MLPYAWSKIYAGLRALARLPSNIWALFVLLVLIVLWYATLEDSIVHRIAEEALKGMVGGALLGFALGVGAHLAGMASR